MAVTRSGISNMGKTGAVVGVQAGMALDLVTCGMITRGLTPLPPPYQPHKGSPASHLGAEANEEIEYSRADRSLEAKR